MTCTAYQWVRCPINCLSAYGIVGEFGILSNFKLLLVVAFGRPKTSPTGKGDRGADHKRDHS
jgi:hypothetical protein